VVTVISKLIYDNLVGRLEVFTVMKIPVMVFWVVVSYHIITQYHNPED